MRYVKRQDAFTRMTDERYSDIECAVCGYGIQEGEPIAWYQDDQICHAECAKEGQAP